MIYLGIVQQRLSHGHQLPASAVEKMDMDQENSPKFFQWCIERLRTEMLQDGLAWTAAESKMLLLMLLGNYCFNVNSELTSEVVTFAGEHDECVNQLNREIGGRLEQAYGDFDVKNHLIHRIGLSLTKTHFRLVYFRGSFSVYQLDQFAQRFNEQLWQADHEFLPDQKFNQFCGALVVRAFQLLGLERDGNETVWNELMGRYAVVMHLLYQSLDVHLRIACDFSFEDLMPQVVIEDVKRHLDNTFPYEISVYDRDEDYDVIVTNQQLEPEESEKTPTFVFFGIEFEFDYPALNAF